MKCSYCNQGTGSNRTKGKDGVIYYYYCYRCVGNFKINPFERNPFESKDGARCPQCQGGLEISALSLHSDIEGEIYLSCPNCHRRYPRRDVK